MKPERNHVNLSRQELENEFYRLLSVENDKHSNEYWRRHEAKINKIIEQLKFMSPNHYIQLHEEEHRRKKKQR